MYMLPAVDILDGKAVRLAEGDYDQVTIYHNDPVEQAKIFQDQGATWLHVVDLDGARTGNADNIAVIERILHQTDLKVEIGGGIRSMTALARLADAGASRMVLGTSLVSDPEFAQNAVETYGEMVAAGIDAREGDVAVSGWTVDSGINAEDFAMQLASLGYTHMVYTDIARDGMQTGVSVESYVAMARTFGHPVIASGGVADIQDIINLAEISNHIEGVITGRAIYEGTLDLEAAIKVCEAATARDNARDNSKSVSDILSV